MDNSYYLLDLTVYGRQEKWEDSPAGWPQQCTYTRTRSGSPAWGPEWPGRRPIAQWPRIEDGYSNDLGNTPLNPIPGYPQEVDHRRQSRHRPGAG